ncbi:MAG: hydroxyacylglutathione hydrolase [Candidatus Marivariicella framensis]|jgi:hydroxyacylglutathione hydrolase|tara:strand:+ start:1178 stop:2563 length:1386 start_codon:yes stop_codon:yes gene_type:complete
MKVEQIYTGCLSQGAYYIESDGEAAIIDPLREVNSYIEKAKSNNVKIKYIFETHFHADFVSGHLTLSKKTGAPIVYGPNADPNYDAIIATDNQVFKIGNCTITVLHTPGHTMESSTYLLKDHNGKDYAIFSGDTLFLGDVGRPDLSQKSDDMTMEDLAGIQYESLRNRIMPLADDVIVYPAHGAGSACGKNMMKETVDILGNQKKMNYALRADMTKEEFIKEVTEGLMPPPTYFPLNVKMNKEGYEDIDSIIDRGINPVSVLEFEKTANDSGAIILDVRHQQDFAKGHIPKSIFIGLKGGFAPWVGTLIADVKQPILLVVEKGKEEEAITRLSRVGFDNTIGYLEGGFSAWKESGNQIDKVTSISAQQFEIEIKNNDSVIFDVRKNSEYDNERIDSAINTPLDVINNYLSDVPDEKNFYVHCAGGYRSMIAASILKSRGVHNLIEIKGGFKSIKETAIPIT